MMRLADMLMSFPSLLLAVVVLYVLEPALANLVLVLAITRVPVYLRTTRAEVLEIRERIYKIIAENTDKDLATVEKDCDRNYWMDAQASLAYGVGDKILEKIPEPSE